MKKFCTYLVALIAGLGLSMNAHAQFSATIEAYPSTDWAATYHDFSLAEVATALGTDAATLVADLDAWMANETPTEFWFQTSDYVPTELAGYTANDRGFWMKLDGTVVSFGQKETEDGEELQAMYNVYAWDAEAGTFSVGIGQMPGKLVAGDQGHVQLVIAKGDKKATFDMTLSVIEKPQADIPDPVTDPTQLTIVKEINAAWDQYPNAPKNQTVDLTGVAELLGTTDEIIAENLDQFLFMPTLELRGDDPQAQKPYKVNTLSNEPTAGGFGWWMAAVWDDELEGFSTEVVRCVWGDHAAFRSMYDEQYSYDAATHTLSSVTGWENYSQELGTKYNYDVYVIYGDKAAVIHHVVTLTTKPEEDPNKWVKIAEESQAVELEKGEGRTAVLNLDLDVIATALDCEVANLNVYGPSDTKGNIDDRHTANNGGFWFSGNGVVCPWAGSDDESSPFTFYIEPVANNDFSSWNVGQNAANITPDQPYTTTFFFFNGAKSETNNKYYAVNISVTFTVTPEEFDEITVVATKNITARVEPITEGWGGDIIDGVDLTELNELIGTSSPDLYAWVPGESGNEFTKEWSCDPKPGFWLTPDGYRTTWQNAANSPFGVCYLADGTFQIFQFVDGNPAGTVRKTSLFLVNPATGAALQCNLSIAFGDVIKYEEVGSKDITLVADPDTEHQSVLVDMTEAVQGMGVDNVSELLSGQCVAVITTDGTWSDLQIPYEGIGIDEQGYLNTEARTFDVYINEGAENNASFSVDNFSGTEIPDDFKITSKMAIQREVAGSLKQYTLNITIVSLKIYTGINGLDAQKGDAVIYDLSGRRTDAARKGVYIVNGKKVVK